MKQKQTGFAHIQIIIVAFLVFSIVGFAAFRVGQSSSNNQQKDADNDTSIAQDIAIKEKEQKEITIPTEKETESEEFVAEKPQPVSEPKPKPVVEEEKKEEKTWLQMDQVSVQQTGSFLNVVSRLPSSQSGKCNFKLYQKNYESVYAYTSMTNATDCSGSLNVSGLATYSGWELHVWFDSFDGKVQASQKQAAISIIKP